VQINDLDHGRLRRLAGFYSRNGHQVLSMYLDLDPAQFGTQPARAAQIRSLLDEADRRTRVGGLDHAARAALRADVERARAFLQGDFSAKGAHALALFASEPEQLFEVLRLPDAVAQGIAVNDRPWLDPLVGRSRTRRCIALINRRTLRLFADGPGGELRELEQLADDVHRQHDQGGWSQANYERSIEEEVRKHVERSARALFARHRRAPYDALAIGCPHELWPTVEHALHPYVRARCLGRVDVDVEHASADDAIAASGELFDADARRRIDELLARVQAGVASGGRAVAGLADVLQALSERRVDALLYEAGFRAPGFVCPQSSWLGVDARICPTGKENAQERENVLDDAIVAAILQSAQVRALRDRPELGPLGGIAAALRF
jgi:hypothetical protein